ncbi:hypothetical protein [Streptomyces caelestis]|uniref:Uncharacterized protein n=1 Tax=Streptomyces caelestis TaxID=36816 RepID=A0A7W9LXX1_9ACTN|nr:hypothetical protein [Streptomyces caelestis]MBB5800022.1 hypothetical protein [Streptomyces caelestis]
MAEGTHFGMVAFSVRGKGFASVTKGRPGAAAPAAGDRRRLGRASGR